MGDSQSERSGECIPGRGGIYRIDFHGAHEFEPFVARGEETFGPHCQSDGSDVSFQQAFARRAGGAALDGRDIGTVICPEAEVKLYVTASDEVRARRRHAELVAGGVDVDFSDILAQLRDRDARDSGRDAAPMKPAEDAHLLDTTELAIATAVAEVVALINKKREAGTGRLG